jgi:hypothetical protein
MSPPHNFYSGCALSMVTSADITEGGKSNLYISVVAASHNTVRVSPQGSPQIAIIVPAAVRLLSCPICLFFIRLKDQHLSTQHLPDVVYST